MLYTLKCCCQQVALCVLTGTFKVDISNTKKLLQGERGEKIREKGIIVRNILFASCPFIVFLSTFIYLYFPMLGSVGCWGIGTIYSCWYCICTRSWLQSSKLWNYCLINYILLLNHLIANNCRPFPSTSKG